MSRYIVNMSTGSGFNVDDSGKVLSSQGFPLSPSVSNINNNNNDNVGSLASGLFGALNHNALLSAGISGGLGVANNLINLITGGLLQKNQWEREDSAHQREVADLKAAGLSPVLSAGGSGLGSSSSTMASYKPNLTEIPAQSISMYSNVLSLQRQAIENMILSKDLSYKDSEIVRKWIGTIFGKI